MTNPACPACGGKTYKDGRTAAGSQRYKCAKCPATAFVLDAEKKRRGREPEGDAPITQQEKSRRHREKDKDEYNKKQRERRRKKKQQSEKPT